MGGAAAATVSHALGFLAPLDLCRFAAASRKSRIAAAAPRLWTRLAAAAREGVAAWEAKKVALLPVLEDASLSLNALDLASITELAHFATPHELCQTAVTATLLVLGKAVLRDSGARWQACRRVLRDRGFMARLMNFDAGRCTPSPRLLRQLRRLTASPDFTHDTVARASVAAACLCSWVRGVVAAWELNVDMNPERAAYLKAVVAGAADKEAWWACHCEALAESDARHINAQYHDHLTATTTNPPTPVAVISDDADTVIPIGVVNSIS